MFENSLKNMVLEKTRLNENNFQVLFIKSAKFGTFNKTQTIRPTLIWNYS